MNAQTPEELKEQTKLAFCAWIDDPTIKLQYLNRSVGWVDMSPSFVWVVGTDYRIAPTPPKPMEFEMWLDLSDGKLWPEEGRKYLSEESNLRLIHVREVIKEEGK